MKKVLSRIGALSVALSVCALGVTAQAEGFDNTAVLGDSIATGYGLPGYSAEDNSAAPSFGNLIAQEGGEYVNLAVDGRTSSELLASLAQEDTMMAVAGAESVVVSIGGNDFLQPMMTAIQTALAEYPELYAALSSGALDTSDPTTAAVLAQVVQSVVTAVSQVDPTVSISNLAQITAGILAINPNCEIYILTVYNPFDGSAGFEGFSELSLLAEQVLTAVNGGIAEIALMSENVAVVDVYSAFKGKANEYTNIAYWDIHPNTAGHSVIYDLLCEQSDSFVDTDIPVDGDVDTDVPVDGDVDTDVTVDGDVDTDVTVDGNADADASKDSPATGVHGLAAALAALTTAGGALVLSRKRADK